MPAGPSSPPVGRRAGPACRLDRPTSTPRRLPAPASGGTDGPKGPTPPGPSCDRLRDEGRLRDPPNGRPGGGPQPDPSPTPVDPRREGSPARWSTHGGLPRPGLAGSGDIVVCGVGVPGRRGVGRSRRSDVGPTRRSSPVMTKTPSDLGLLARILLRCVRGYQRVADGRPTPCRYVPTCSNYALDAVEGHGAVRGAVLVVRRLARCHPWGGQGWDPVPHRTPSARPRPVLNADAVHE